MPSRPPVAVQAEAPEPSQPPDGGKSGILPGIYPGKSLTSRKKADKIREHLYCCNARKRKSTRLQDAQRAAVWCKADGRMRGRSPWSRGLKRAVGPSGPPPLPGKLKWPGFSYAFRQEEWYRRGFLPPLSLCGDKGGFCFLGGLGFRRLRAARSFPSDGKGPKGSPGGRRRGELRSPCRLSPRPPLRGLPLRRCAALPARSSSRISYSSLRPRRAKLGHFIASPLQRKPTSLGFALGPPSAAVWVCKNCRRCDSISAPGFPSQRDLGCWRREPQGAPLRFFKNVVERLGTTGRSGTGPYGESGTVSEDFVGAGPRPARVSLPP